MESGIFSDMEQGSVAAKDDQNVEIGGDAVDRRLDMPSAEPVTETSCVISRILVVRFGNDPDPADGYRRQIANRGMPLLTTAGISSSSNFRARGSTSRTPLALS